jgi:hypothetical protein
MGFGLHRRPDRAKPGHVTADLAFDAGQAYVVYEEERITLNAQRPTGLRSVEREYKGPPDIGLVAYADFRFRERNGSGRRRWMSLLSSRQEKLEALAFVALSRPLPAALEA